MATPTTYPAAKQAMGVNKETVQGTAITTGPVATIPFDSFAPQDMFVQLDDKALRGSMVDRYGRQQGPSHSEWTLQGPAFLDTLPYWINNLMGDITTTGSAPQSHAMSVLNSGTGQPGSLTLIDWQGLTATTQARAYPGACVSELTLSGNAASSLITCEVKGLAYPSIAVPTTPPTFSPSAVTPQAAWKYGLGLGGTFAGAPNKTVRDFTVTVSRALTPEWTLQNVQGPYIIQRGPISLSGSFTFTVPSDETALSDFLNNTQPQIQIIGSVGSGATAFGLQMDMLLAAFDTVTLKTDEDSLGYNVTFVGVANTTNVGASGGYGPIKYTVTNQTAAGTY